jgi:hypothetical protein
MPDQEIEVISYSGYREEENPRSFIVNMETITIEEIVYKWIEEEFHSRNRKRFFKVTGDDGFLYSIYRDESSHKWFIKKK